MELQVGKWGNSLAVRLPAGLVKDLGLQEGLSLSTQELGQRLLSVTRSANVNQIALRRELIESIKKMHENMPVTRPVTKDEMSRY